MFVKLSICVFLGIFSVALSHTTQEREKITKLNVTVYYEALCPDSAKFITEQVYPLIANQNTSLAHYLNVVFVPYGKSNYSVTAEGNYTFSCHHGEEECVANKYQACAIKHVTNKTQLYHFINCTMGLGYLNKNNNTQHTIERMCAVELKLTPEDLNTCALSAEGDELLANYGNMTMVLTGKPLSSVPVVTINDKVNPEALKDLKKASCLLIPSGNTVAECNVNGAPTLTLSFITIALSLLLSRLN